MSNFEQTPPDPETNFELAETTVHDAETAMVNETLETYERIVGDRVMRVTVIPPEDPETIKERDRIEQPMTGIRPMVETSSPFANGASHGRRAPKYVGERSSHRRS